MSNLDDERTDAEVSRRINAAPFMTYKEECEALREQVERLTAASAEYQRQAFAYKKDAERLSGLRQLCGYIEDGSGESVTIFQDDATRDWIIRVGGPGSRKWWYGCSFENVIYKAMEGK